MSYVYIFKCLVDVDAVGCRVVIHFLVPMYIYATSATCIWIYTYIYIYAYMYIYVHITTWKHTYLHCRYRWMTSGYAVAGACNTLQHTATHYTTLQHTATHCNILQHTATYCNTLHHCRYRWMTSCYAVAGAYLYKHIHMYTNLYINIYICTQICI